MVRVKASSWEVLIYVPLHRARTRVLVPDDAIYLGVCLPCEVFWTISAVSVRVFVTGERARFLRGRVGALSKFVRRSIDLLRVLRPRLMQSTTTGLGEELGLSEVASAMLPQQQTGRKRKCQVRPVRCHGASSNQVTGRVRRG